MEMEILHNQRNILKLRRFAVEMVNFGPITTEDFILGVPRALADCESFGEERHAPCCPSRGKSGFGSAFERGKQNYAETMARTLLIMT